MSNYMGVRWIKLDKPHVLPSRLCLGFNAAPTTSECFTVSLKRWQLWLWVWNVSFLKRYITTHAKQQVLLYVMMIIIKLEIIFLHIYRIPPHPLLKTWIEQRLRLLPVCLPAYTLTRWMAKETRRGLPVVLLMYTWAPLSLFLKVL